MVLERYIQAAVTYHFYKTAKNVYTSVCNDVIVGHKFCGSPVYTSVCCLKEALGSPVYHLFLALKRVLNFQYLCNCQHANCFSYEV